MERVAVFIDAGYLFAQGSAALTGSKKTRFDLTLTAKSVVEELKAFAQQKAPSCSLLRIYWYDGVGVGSQPTSEQSQIAHLDDVKLRLGFINSAGQQKGVDSLIVTDLIELARQKAISEAVLLSGDEDVRVGVQIAQNYGVRIHLLGIIPSRGSQSRQLVQEADTTTEWDSQTVGKFLSLRAGAQRQTAASQITPTHAVPSVPARAATPTNAAGSTQPSDGSTAIRLCVETFVHDMEAAEISAIEQFWLTQRGLPSDFDRKVLAQSRDAIGRELDVSEKRLMRVHFRAQVLQRTAPKIAPVVVICSSTRFSH